MKYGGDEGTFRTVISRSYYAALLYSAMWINENYQKVDWDRKHLHRFVPAHIGRWLPEPYNREIPKVFHALRKRREVADYQPAIGIDKRDALVALKEAEHIVNTLRNLPKS